MFKTRQHAESTDTRACELLYPKQCLHKFATQAANCDRGIQATQCGIGLGSRGLTRQPRGQSDDDIDARRASNIQGRLPPIGRLLSERPSSLMNTRLTLMCFISHATALPANWKCDTIYYALRLGEARYSATVCFEIRWRRNVSLRLVLLTWDTPNPRKSEFPQDLAATILVSKHLSVLDEITCSACRRLDVVYEKLQGSFRGLLPVQRDDINSCRRRDSLALAPGHGIAPHSLSVVYPSRLKPRMCMHSHRLHPAPLVLPFGCEIV